MSRDTDAKAGLLGKVAKFIKNPTVDWSDLDRADGPSNPPSSLNSRQSRLALKEMMARKRRNDLVRRHEFDKLRKIRRGGKGPPGEGLNSMGLNSLYSSTQLAHDTEKPDGEQKRERTLRQIDEIEAQLSRSWFSKAGTGSTVPMKSRPAQPQPASGPPSARTVPPDTPMSAPAAATEREKSRPSIPAVDFVPATLPVGVGVLGQPRPSARAPIASAPPLPESASSRPAPAPGQPEPPVLTQTYLSPVARGSPSVPPPSQPAAARPRQQWKDPALDGMAVHNPPGGFDFQEFAPPANAPRPGNRAPEPPPRSSPAVKPAVAPGSGPRRRASAYDDGLEHNIEVVALRQDPEIEEAAISFANGDEAGAELTLLKLVSTGGSRRKDVDVWLALFDLYRVTGKSEAFDGMVPEFIALFGRSAPQWERAQDGALSDQKRAAPQTAIRQGAFAWTSPAQLNARALTGLTSAARRTAPPWRIDWRLIRTVEPDVLPQFNELLAQWADTPVQLQFLGGEQLLAVLASQSPTGNKNVNPAWWRVRLNLLRLMGSPDPFDQTALDYCITYEISPPAWAPPKGSYMPLTADGQPEALVDDDAAIAPRAFAPTTITGELLATTGIFKTTLAGEILGQADQALAGLPQQLDRIQAFDFDCRALRRVDFGAAGALLNWSIEQQSQGRTVTFFNLHRLLAAFFSVIGINTTAQVVLRKD